MKMDVGEGGVLAEWMSTIPDFPKYNCEQNSPQPVMSQPYPVPIPIPQPKSRPLPDSRGIPDTLNLRKLRKLTVTEISVKKRPKRFVSSQLFHVRG